MIGYIKSWNAERGFGFARCKDGRADVFIHVSSFEGERKPQGWEPPIGAEVMFEIERDPRSGRERAAAGVEFV